ncbi:PIN domain-containing protein [Micromonospora sp. NPDC004336]
MMISLVPGTSHAAVRSTLVHLQDALASAQQAGPGRAVDRAYRYLEWMHEARRLLRNQIRPAGLEQLLPMQSYKLVLSAVGAHQVPLVSLPREQPAGGALHLGGERLLNGLVAAQADERVQALAAAVTDLDGAVQRFSRQFAQVVVLDTNVYIHHERKLEDLDLAGELTLGIADIRIIVPMMVVDELDKAKLSGGDKGYRAGYTVAYIDRVAQAGGQIRAAAYEREPDPRGGVSVEVLLDPVGHVRLPINDDEIVDRAVSLEPLAGQPVRLVTFDTGMALRARAAGLRVHKLEQPPKAAAKRCSAGEPVPATRAEHRG